MTCKCRTGDCSKCSCAKAKIPCTEECHGGIQRQGACIRWAHEIQDTNNDDDNDDEDEDYSASEYETEEIRSARKRKKSAVSVSASSPSSRSSTSGASRSSSYSYSISASSPTSRSATNIHTSTSYPPTHRSSSSYDEEDDDDDDDEEWTPVKSRGKEAGARVGSGSRHGSIHAPGPGRSSPSVNISSQKTTPYPSPIPTPTAGQGQAATTRIARIQTTSPPQPAAAASSVHMTRSPPRLSPSPSPSPPSSAEYNTPREYPVTPRQSPPTRLGIVALLVSLVVGAMSLFHFQSDMHLVIDMLGEYTGLGDPILPISSSSATRAIIHPQCAIRDDTRDFVWEGHGGQKQKQAIQTINSAITHWRSIPAHATVILVGSLPPSSSSSPPPPSSLPLDLELSSALASHLYSGGPTSAAICHLTPNDFIDADKLHDKILEQIAKCPNTMFIIQQVQDIPETSLYGLEPFFSTPHYFNQKNGVRYEMRRVLFLLLNQFGHMKQTRGSPSSPSRVSVASLKSAASRVWKRQAFAGRITFWAPLQAETAEE